MPKRSCKRIRRLLLKLDIQRIKDEAILELKELAKEARRKASQRRASKSPL